ncbi:MAG: superoxide dismutase [Candidatus Woesearchaeota archaeon]
MMEELVKLNYEYDALEPYIDETTMMIHHSKHHQAYVDKFNAAIKGSEFENKSVDDILRNLISVSEDIRKAVINNGGGVWNHNFFWSILKKGVVMSDELKSLLEKDFGSVEKFKEEFTNAALTQFGSGWAWLVLDESGKLKVVKTPNQDSPISSNLKPVLALDVWEHAYYLKYQNKRPDYVNNFWNVVDWDKVLSLIKE